MRCKHKSNPPEEEISTEGLACDEQVQDDLAQRLRCVRHLATLCYHHYQSQRNEKGPR